MGGISSQRSMRSRFALTVIHEDRLPVRTPPWKPFEPAAPALRCGADRPDETCESEGGETPSSTRGRNPSPGIETIVIIVIVVVISSRKAAAAAAAAEAGNGQSMNDQDKSQSMNGMGKQVIT
jgi:hypothetical protein